MQLKSSNKSKTKTKKNKKGRIALLILIGLFIVYVGAEVYNSVFNKISTEVVGYGKAKEAISVEGIIIRNESLVTSNNPGIINYMIRDGEKVAIGTKVASYYSKKEDINSINYLNVLDKQIQAYESINIKSGIGSADPISNDAMIGKNVKSVITYNLKGRFQDAYDVKNIIQMLINRRRYLTGDVANFDTELASLRAQRAQIAPSAASSIYDVYTNTSGYFLKNLDGFEKIISADNMSKYDVSAIRDLLSGKGQTYDSSVIGKVVSDFEFTYSAIVKKQTADNLKVGQSVEIEFDSLDNVALPAEITRISNDTDGNCVVDIRCNYMADCINLQRKQKAQIVVKTYTGLKVPQGAVRMVDNQKGVYILAGTQARFKKIEPMFFKDGYYIVKQDFGNSGSLLLYDTVITKGNDLYNNKIVK